MGIIERNWFPAIVLAIFTFLGFGHAATTGDVTNYDRLTVSTFTDGGGVTSTSTTGAAVALVAADFDTENVVAVTTASTSVTVSLPASTTLTAFIPNAGDRRTLWFRNASTSANAVVTFAGGTGVLLKNAASSTPTLIGDTDGSNMLRIDFMRKTTQGDIEAYTIKYQD